MQRTYIIGQNVRLTICDAVGTPTTTMPFMTPAAATAARVAATAAVAAARAPAVAGAPPGVPVNTAEANERAAISLETTIHTAAPAAGPASTSTVIVFRGTEFTIVAEQTDYVVIKMLRWSNDPAKNKVYYDPSAASTSATVFFLLPKSEFNKALDRLPRAAFAVGAITMPIKLRFGSKEESSSKPQERYFNFEGSINVGLSAGVAIRLNKSKFINRDYLNLLAGVSITSVPVDSFSTKGLIKTNTNTSAFTWNITALYQRDNFQAGIFFGKDYLAGEIGRQWVYRNKLWMGIGLGFSIFQTKRSTDTEQ